jgi:DNA-binding transcriptional LysR family regulator
MQKTHIHGLDLKLAPALEALLRLRSVSRAAAELGLSQPAMSRALARLRDVLDDPLLVSAPGGYALTAKATALQPRLADAMAALGEVFHPARHDPTRERRTVRLAASDLHTGLFLPHVIARLAREAPGVDLQVEAYSPATVDRVLGGAVDLAFAQSVTPLPPGASSAWLGEDRLALVMRRGHPAADRVWTLGDYAVWPQAAVSLTGDGVTEMDARLAAIGARRRLALVTPYFSAALQAVAASDCVTTLSEAFARRHAATLDLVVREPPFADAAFGVTLVCHERLAADPLLVWLTTLLREATQAAGLRGRAPLPPASRTLA